MNQTVIKVGVTIIFVGSVVFLIGTIGEDSAYGTLIRAAGDIYDNSLLVRAYEQTRSAALAKNFGLFIFMLGVGITLYGMGQGIPEPPLAPRKILPLLEEYPPQGSSQRYPPQRF